MERSLIYNHDQLLLYLAAIGYDLATHNPSVANLELIVGLHLRTFPFENTSMHYTESHSMDVTHEGIFQRLVVDQHGGSYCFGLNRILMEMLKLLGYRVSPGSARVNRNSEPGPKSSSSSSTQPNFGPTSHMLLFVQLPESALSETYVVDVGFGGSCLMRPILLKDGAEAKGMTGSEHHRLVVAPPETSGIHFSSNSTSEWYLQIQHLKPPATTSYSPTNWRTLYAFYLHPASQPDYDNASYIITHHPSSNIFRSSVVAVLPFLIASPPSLPNASDNSLLASVIAELIKPEEGDMGKFVLFGNTLKLSVGHTAKVMKTMESEAERVALLKDFFNVRVAEEGVRWIEGREAALEARARS
ncbi:hypothetical protein BDV98DRAFT_603874 [Pterulicium gracile]|uniref:Uncharacterized protein n=1 Tax=Pterulicium gracile TaxID=1884261 RepID=A0A5C3QN14_9AGAR|nr:hypothetical protein BDV98DRAFT_603874 [Pterula gracilis]